MLRFAIRRTLMAVPTLLIVAVSVFVLIRLIPGDPASLMLGDMARSGAASPICGSGWGSTEPAGAVRDLARQCAAGRSRPVDHVAASRCCRWSLERFWVSAQIVLVAVLLASLIAVPAGMIAAWRQNSLLDLALVGTATLLLSIPTFWLGLLLLLFFGLKLGWLPVVGYVSFARGSRRRRCSTSCMPVMTLVTA